MSLITLTMVLFYSCVLVGHGSVTVSQNEQYQHPETETAKSNSAIINFILKPTPLLFQAFPIMSVWP